MARSRRRAGPEGDADRLGEACRLQAPLHEQRGAERADQAAQRALRLPPRAGADPLQRPARVIVRQAADDEVATSVALYNDALPRDAVSWDGAEAFDASA